MGQNSGKLYIGTCSWKYDSWVGIVYTRRDKQQYLVEYARHYRTVEIDQWFWSLFPGGNIKLPDPGTVEAYAAAVPPDFKFTVKVPNSITLTHYYQRNKQLPLQENPYFLSPELFQQFLTILKPLVPKVGAFLFQFEYLNKQKMPSQKQFLDHLEQFFEKIPAGLPYAIEIRNPNYLNATYFRFLKSRQLGMVFLQGYYMPPIFEVYEKYRVLLHEPVILRLHGPDRQAMEKKSNHRWDTIRVARDKELQRVAQMVTELVNSGKTVYVNVNNHYEGSAPRTIDRLTALLRVG